ncbi:hypothetical protein [Streptomyces sp. BRA346]|uniref:hypothetical protein n=1 Tax=Streptomyces sp. BRA346 TaxID=2878199 RepID=UPI004064982E
MPETWVSAVADAIGKFGWSVSDAHESAIVVELTADASRVLQADDDERFVVLGWAEDTEGPHYGLSRDGIQVPILCLLGPDTDPAAIAARVDRLMRTGQPEARLVRHAIPYAALGSRCVCPTAHPCLGIVPNAHCPEHGDRQAPTMEWHWEENCGTVAAR